MAWRQVIALIAVGSFLVGCVSSGHQRPMQSVQGRNEAISAYVSLGVGYLERGESEKAKVPLRKALDLDSSNADVHAALALVFQAELETELADQHYRRALSNRPNDARLQNNYGSFLFEQKNFKEALVYFAKAAQDNLYPERSRVFENIGLTQLQMGDTAAAQESFTRALRLNSNQPRSLFAMAKLSYQAQEYVLANSYFQRFSQLASLDAQGLLLGAQLARIFEDRSTAASLGLQLKRLYPTSPEYSQFVAEQ